MLAPNPNDYSRQYEGDIGGGYPQPVAERRGISLPRTLITGAAMMLAFPIVHRISQRGISKLSRGAARIASRSSGRATRAWSRAAGEVGAQGGPTLGRTIRNTSSVDSMITKYRAWQRSSRIDVAAYGAWAQGSGRGYSQMAAEGSPIANRVSNRMSKFSSFFNDRHSPAFRGRVMGGVEHLARDYAKSLPPILVASKVIGMVTEPRREAGPAWWNLPGHIRSVAGDMTRSAIGYLPVHLAFKAMPGSIKLGKDAMEYTMRRAYSGISRASGGGRTGQEQLYNTLRQVERLRNRAVGSEDAPGFISRLRGASKEYFRSFSISHRGRRPSPTDTALSWWRNIQTGWERGLVKSYKPLTQIPQANLIQDLGKITDQSVLGAFVRSGTPLTGDSMTRLLGDAFRSHDEPSMGFLSRIAGLRAKQFTSQTVEDTMRRAMLQNLPPALATSIEDWLRSRYYGKGVFQGGAGRTINLSHWRPTEVISRVVNFAHEKVGFQVGPHSKLKPLQIFNAKRMKDAILGRAPNVYEWTEGHKVRVGPLPADAARAIGSYDPRGAMVSLQAGERMLFIKSGTPARTIGGGAGRMIFMPAAGESASALPTVLPHQYKLVEEPLHGSLRNVQDIFYGARTGILDRFDAANPGQEAARMQEALGWGRTRAWFHSRVLRNPSAEMQSRMGSRRGGWGGLEIGAGYGQSPGPLTRTRNLFMKYFRPDSPLVYMSEERGFLTEMATQGSGHNYVNSSNLQPTIQFISGTRNALNESLDESWHILRRREIFNKYASHQVSIPGWQDPTAPTLGELFGDGPSSRRKLVQAVDNLLATSRGSQLPGPWEKARHILDTVRNDEGYWSHAITKSPRGRELTASDELQKFIFRHHIINQAKSNRGYKYLQGITQDVNIGRPGLLSSTNRDMSLLRSVDNLAHVEERLSEMGLGGIPDPTDPNFLNALHSRHGITDSDLYSRLNNTVSYLMGERRSLADLSRIFTPPWSTKLPNILQAPIHSRSTTTSPYEVVVSTGFPSVAEQLQTQGTRKGIGSILSPRYMSRTEGVPEVGGGALTQPSRFIMETTLRFEKLAQSAGMGLNLGRRTTYQDIWSGIFSRMVVPGIVGYSGYKLLDTTFDISPAFSGTSLDEGLTVALGEQYMKHDLRVSSLMDITGVTAASRYVEGLMPGMISSPASRIGRIAGPPLAGASIGMLGGPTTAGIGMFVGAGAGILGLNDTTRTRSELEDIYSGRTQVPVRSGAGWLFGRTSLFGGRIKYFRPNWFARMKSQYQYTPDLYGSKAEEFMFRNPLMMPFSQLWDPYHWERKSYFSSPYPETGGLLESVPFAGPVLSATVGRAVKPIRTMHKEQLGRSFHSPADMGGDEAGAGWNPPPGIQTTVPSPFAPATVKEYNSQTGMQIRRPYPTSMHSIRQTLGRTFYRSWVEPMGLFGWGSELALGGHPFDSDVVMANAGERTSTRREFWNMMNSGIGGISEFPRRFFPRQRKQLERWNPLRNRMPGWLPGGMESEYFIDFKTGDPFMKIPDGELRLPGWGNMAAYHNELSMPFRASQIGRNYDEQVQFLTGTRPPATVAQEEYMDTGTVMHRMVQDELRRANLLVKAEAPVFDPYSNITGTVDAIVRSGRRNVALEIKTTSTKKMEAMARPDRAHISQINFYMKALGMREGFIMYLDRDNPEVTRTFPVQYSQELYKADLAKVGRARAQAGKLLRMGYGYPGEAYSHMDRLRVLSDVAPYSNEYKKEYKIIKQMGRAGLLSSDEEREKIDIVKRRNAMVRTYDLYPRRFDMAGIFHPDERYEQMSQNEFIKSAAEYGPGERAVGAAWEYMTHQRSPIHSKLLGMYTPLEQYERTVLYGNKAAFWSEPWRDFVEPYMRASMATRKPGEGLIRGLQAGFLLGGAPGAAMGAGALGVYGAVHGGFRWLTDSTYIPGNVQNKWEVSQYFDNLKYVKARRLYQMTGQEEYSRTMSETMAGMNPLSRNRQSFTNIARAVPYQLKPFIFAFMKEEDPKERSRILQEVPTNVGQLLQIKWAQYDGEVEEVGRYADDFRASNELEEYYGERHLPGESWMGWHPSVPMEDVLVKTVQKEGMDAHDYGHGWYNQMRRIRYSPLTPGAINMGDPTGEEIYPELSLDRAEVNNIITGIIKQFGGTNVMVNTSVTPGMGSRVTINVAVDRGAELEQGMRRGI